MRLSKKLDCFVISDNVKNDRAEKDSAIYLWRQSHNKTINQSVRCRSSSLYFYTDTEITILRFHLESTVKVILFPRQCTWVSNFITIRIIFSIGCYFPSVFEFESSTLQGRRHRAETISSESIHSEAGIST